MKRLLLGAMAAAMIAAFSGCICIGAKLPVSVGDMSRSSTRVGTAKAQNIIIIAFGDASISAVCKDSGITKIHHVDCQVMNVLGIYSEWETIVYGE